MRSGALIHLLPVGKDGSDVDALQAACRRGRVDAAVVDADFQNPTGALMSAETRRRLVQVAQEEDVVLIDDRTHSDLDHGATAPPPLGRLTISRVSSRSAACRSSTGVGCASDGSALERR